MNFFDLITVVTGPLLVGFSQQFTDKIPSFLKPVLAVAASALVALVGGGDLTHGVTLGAAGVGVRELLDQTKKLIPS